MGVLYSVSFADVAVTAQQDFFEIQPATNEPIVIHELGLFQTSEVGDAAEEMLRIAIIRGHTTSGTAVNTPNKEPLRSSDSGASGSFTVEANNTVIASAGTTAILYAATFNVRVGLEKIWTPETRPGASAANTTIVVRLLTTPADSIQMSGYLYVEEGA